MTDFEGRRIVFGDVWDRICWGLIVAVLSYGVIQIQSLTRAVSELNESMAVIKYQIPDQMRRMDRIEARQDRLAEEMRLMKLMKLTK